MSEPTAKRSTSKRKTAKKRAPAPAKPVVTIEVDAENPMKFGDAEVARMDVRPLTYAEFVSAVSFCSQEAGRSERPFQTLLLRVQIGMQTTIVGTDGKHIKMTPEGLDLVPQRYAKQLTAAVLEMDGEPGEVVGEVVPGGRVNYRLGTPIPIKGGAITELEMSASTFGDLEDVMAAQTELDKGFYLIRDRARPLGTGVGGLQTLPESALEQITLADGLKIVRDVLPAFVD